jgi:hypothetical protein
MTMLTNHVWLHIAVIMPLLLFGTEILSFAQAHIAISDVTRIERVVVPNPANVSTLVSGPGLTLRGPARYHVKVAFDSNDTPFLRVQMYEQAGNAAKPSINAEGWRLIQRFSSGGSMTEKLITLSKDARLLITSWYPDSNRSGGMSDSGIAYHVEETTQGNKKGLVFKFNTPYGSTIVTILPA